MSRRIELGISLEQAARDTNIRARMLEALESGDYSQYPPRGHAIGMLSSYARYLDLDSASIVEVFDSEYEAYSSSREIEKIANNTRRGVGRFGERVIGEKPRPISRESSRRRGHLEAEPQPQGRSRGEGRRALSQRKRSRRRYATDRVGSRGPLRTRGRYGKLRSRARDAHDALPHRLEPSWHVG